MVGILLISLAVSTLFCASGIRAGERWAWRIGLINGLGILSLSVVLVLTMERRYFSAIPFLVASSLVTLVGFSMIWPLLWVRPQLGARERPLEDRGMSGDGGIL